MLRQYRFDTLGRSDTLAGRHTIRETPIMRAILVVSLVALLFPAAALAQTAPAPSTATAPSTAMATPRSAPAKGGDITRDQYIEHATERAKRAAEKRFERMDANHDGVLSTEERRGARAARAQRRAAPSQ